MISTKTSRLSVVLLGWTLILTLPVAGMAETSDVDGGMPASEVSGVDENDSDAGVQENVATGPEPVEDNGSQDTPSSLESAQDTAEDESIQDEPVSQNEVDEEDDVDPGMIAGDMDMMGMDLEELLETPVEVWTATKTKSTIWEAPAVISVITQEDIQIFGFQSIAEILNHTLGFYVVNDHILPNVGMRGISGSFMGESGLLKVMVDGHSVAFRSTGGNWLGPELIPLTAIERIEIIRGPVSALYGADAFLGVVNIITTKGGDLSLGRGQFSGNMTDRTEFGYDVDFALGSRKGQVEWNVSGRVNQLDYSGLRLPSSSPAPNIPSYNAEEKTAAGLELRSHVAHGIVTYHLKDKHRISLLGRVSQIDRGGEFSPWSHLSYGLDEEGRQHQTTVSLYQGMVGLLVSLEPVDTLSLDWRLSYLRGGPTDKDSIDVTSDVYRIKREFGYQSIENALEGRWQIMENLTTVLGTEFMYDWEDLPSSLHVASTSIGNVAAGEVIESSSTMQGSQSIYNIGGFVQILYSGLKPYLDMTYGLRYDHHSIYGNQWNGRIGFTSNPQKMLYLKLLTGSAFKAPSPLMLYGVPHQVGDIYGNPELKPQRVYNVEGQIILKPIKYLSLSTGLAYNHMRDKAEFVQQGINRIAKNVSKVQSLTVESEIIAQYDEWLRGSLSYEHPISSREFDSPSSPYMNYLIGNRNVIYPSRILRFNLSARAPVVPLRAGLQLMYVGERPASEMNALENVGMYELDSYVLFNATLATVGIKLIDQRETTFSFTVRNVTGRNVADPGYAGIDYPIAPMTFYLQMRQEF